MIAVIAGRQAVEDSRGLQGLSGRDLYIFHVGDLLKVASCGTCKAFQGRLYLLRVIIYLFAVAVLYGRF